MMLKRFIPKVIRLLPLKICTAKSLVNSKLPFQLTIKRRRKIPYGTPRYIYQQRLNRFEISPGESVLDIGSGNHPFPMATILLDALREPGVVMYGRPFIVADVHFLPFKDKSIEFVYCSHLLEHVDDPRRACNEICRVGKEGYIETPNFMKDALFSWALGMHKWHTVAINNELHFFEYTERQARGIQFTIWGEMIQGPIYHKMQDVFWDNQDLFNTMFGWENSFRCVVHRRNRPRPDAHEKPRSTR